MAYNLRIINAEVQLRQETTIKTMFSILQMTDVTKRINKTYQICQFQDDRTMD